MITVLFAVLLVACVAAPFLGVDTSDSRTEDARPAQGWYPALPTH